MSDAPTVTAETIAIPHECRQAGCEVTFAAEPDGRIWATHNSTRVDIYATPDDVHALDTAILVQHVREEQAGRDADHPDRG